MAYATNPGYTNRTESATRSTRLYDLGLLSNYALMEDEPTECRLINKTAAIDREEVISYRSKKIAKVTTSLDVQNPSPVATGTMYGVQTESIWTTEDASDLSVGRIDSPMVITISIRQERNARITSAMVEEQLERTISALQNADGTWRIDDLMRSALKPTKE
jgi:hypothetical protein